MLEYEATSVATDSMAEVVQTTAASNQEFALFFLLGGLFTLLIYFLWSSLISKKANRKL